jgi:tetraacyldisaccharide 4'-kinase
LRAASWPYGAGVSLRDCFFTAGWKRIERVPVPVVSVGNLTLGGTGKTPCVEYLARHYRGRDAMVAIVSRGYGGGDGLNDEALVLAENLPDVPHLQGSDRVALARLAIEDLESDLLILDDGFQHRRLARLLDIVLIDATEPWGFGRLFPRGLLREPPRALCRADAVVLTRCDAISATAVVNLRNTVLRLAPSALVAQSVHRPLAWRSADGLEMGLDQLGARPAYAFCGIGNPTSFRNTLAQLGIMVQEFRIFPDHHAYRRTEIEDLGSWAERLPADGVVLTTQKDMVKIRLARLGERELWALRIGFCVVEQEAAFQQLLDQIMTR